MNRRIAQKARSLDTRPPKLNSAGEPSPPYCREVGNVSDGDTVLLQENPRKRMAAAAGLRFLFPRSAKLPEFVQLAPPAFGNDFQRFRPMHSKNKSAVLLGSCANAAEAT